MIKDFECIKCGNCCRTLTVVEYGAKLPCLHLDQEKNLCKIYEDRCDTCKNYPHTIEFAIKTGCNGNWPEKEKKQPIKRQQKRYKKYKYN